MFTRRLTQVLMASSGPSEGAWIWGAPARRPERRMTRRERLRMVASPPAGTFRPVSGSEAQILGVRTGGRVASWSPTH